MKALLCRWFGHAWEFFDAPPFVANGRIGIRCSRCQLCAPALQAYRAPGPASTLKVKIEADTSQLDRALDESRRKLTRLRRSVGKSRKRKAL